MSFVSSAPEYRTKRKSDLSREVAYFLASPGAVEAARLGWTDLDLFGVDADRPYTRIDVLGLVPRSAPRRQSKSRANWSLTKAITRASS